MGRKTGTKKVHTHKNKKSSTTYGEADMKVQLARLSLVEKDIAGDGNCLFSSLADQLFGDVKRQKELRENICNYIESNEGDFKSFLDENDESFEKYVQRMKNDKTYGTNLELVAASRLYNRAIYVHQLGQAPWKIGEDAITSGGGNSPVHILYHNHEHYSYAMCYFFLNKTSRSFARVIQSLHEELRHTVAIFYRKLYFDPFNSYVYVVVLRGLDTIEDDMTIPAEEKVKLLRSFHLLTVQDGWNYHGNGADEKDALLLQRYEVVVKELNKLKPKYDSLVLSSHCCLLDTSRR